MSVLFVLESYVLFFGSLSDDRSSPLVVNADRFLTVGDSQEERQGHRGDKRQKSTYKQ